jgi:2-oxoglutarate ferredoxin oxidoreductase subunit beta
MFDYSPYLRLAQLPHIWCPGCGNGIVTKALLRAIEHSGLDRDRVALVSGIGCSGRLTVYADFDTLHTTHGRALAFATGLKLARPELTVVVITGDGDGLAIGGNHLIHAARRNLELTCVLFNNQTYGMTGGQLAPTTAIGRRTTTTPDGNIEGAFDACALVRAAGGTFVARGSTFQATSLESILGQALAHPGFAFVEVLTDCPELFGRHNKLGDGARMLLAQKERTVPEARARRMSAEDLEGKDVIGVLSKGERPEFARQYAALRARAGAGPAQ